MIRLLILSSFIFFSSVSYAQKKHVNLKIDSANYYLENGQYIKAIRFLDDRIATNASADLFIARGLAKIEINDLDGALFDLKNSLKLSAKNDTSYYNIGYVLYLQGNYSRAINYYDSALSVNKDNIYYLIARGDSFLELENVTSAYHNVCILGAAIQRHFSDQ